LQRISLGKQRSNPHQSPAFLQATLGNGFVKKIKIAFAVVNPLRGTAPNNFNRWLLLQGQQQVCVPKFTQIDTSIVIFRLTTA
jgi:hypothetical protein